MAACTGTDIPNGEDDDDDDDDDGGDGSGGGGDDDGGGGDDNGGNIINIMHWTFMNSTSMHWTWLLPKTKPHHTWGSQMH